MEILLLIMKLFCVGLITVMLIVSHYIMIRFMLFKIPSIIKDSWEEMGRRDLELATGCVFLGLMFSTALYLVVMWGVSFTIGKILI